MKSLLRKILGERVISAIKTIFPSKARREADKRAADDAKVRSPFYSTFVKAGDLCFDVGANMGNRVRPLLLLGARVVAVEPQEVCHTYLRKEFGKKITLVTKGLGETETIKKFYLTKGTVLSSFSEEWINSVKTTRFANDQWDSSVEVEMTTADKLIENYGVPAFIKIDVEGYELEVLKGLTQPVGMISFEYTVPEQAEKPVLCIEQVNRYNKDIECNYSIGETMKFELDHWLSAADMKNYVKTQEFIDTGFGDIYIRTKI